MAGYPVAVETVLGVIEAKSKDGKKIKVGPEWFSSFSPIIYERDTQVKINFVRKGVFNNIKSIDMVDEDDGADIKGPSVAKATPKAAPTAYKRMGDFPLNPLDGQISIVRQNALTNAVNAVIHGALIVKESQSGDFTFEKFHDLATRILSVARQFEDYTAGFADKRNAEKAVAEMMDTKE